MPTGYTAKIIDRDDVSFQEFALDCAKAFGANIRLRDEPADTPIQKYSPDSYYVKAMETARNEYARLLSMDESQRLAYGEEKKRSQIDEYRKYVADAEVKSARLNRMLKSVMEWTPPTDEHVGMKEFMIEQLQSTIQNDGNGSYYQDSIDRHMATDTGQYHADALKSSADSIEYYERKSREEIDRVDGRNDWNRKLIDSLPKGKK